MGKRATRPRICQSLQCLDRRISNVVSLLQDRRRRFWAMECFCVCVRVRVRVLFVCVWLSPPVFRDAPLEVYSRPPLWCTGKMVCNAVDSRECLSLVVICVQWARRNKSRTPVFRYKSNVHCSLDIYILATAWIQDMKSHKIEQNGNNWEEECCSVGILTWHGRYHDQLGGPPRARPFHCTPVWLTPAITPNAGDSSA